MAVLLRLQYLLVAVGKSSNSEIVKKLAFSTYELLLQLCRCHVV